MKSQAGSLLSRRRRPARVATRDGRSSLRRLRYESLEDRRLLSAAPFGAYPDDTAEYMLGDVLVTVVLMESNTKISTVNHNTEDWTPGQIATVKQKVQQGVEWWEQALAAQFPDSPTQLDFRYDFTYADTPVLTSYEPISQISDSFQYWMYDFLNQVGHNQSGDFSDDIRAFNHAQRLAHGTDWAFTVFVVNDANDADRMFEYGGSFRRAFSFAGGQFIVSPAERPASTFAHETGHMFWAKDEYEGSAPYSDRRGYYNTQNLNAVDGNPMPGFQQADSIMTTDDPPTDYPFSDAYSAHTSSVSSLEMIGWRDSDGDGIFDVLDVPNTLSGAGFLDPLSGQYRFIGESSVQALFNRNSSGFQNDITLNKIGRAEVRVDGGVWTTVATFAAPVVDLDLQFAVPDSGTHTIELRTVEAVSGITSPIFQGDTSRPSSVLRQGINGFVWNDVNRDGVVNNEEGRLAGWTVRLVDAGGSPLDLTQTLDPDAYTAGTVLNSVLPQAALSLEGDPMGRVVAMASGNGKVFGNDTSFAVASPIWKPKGSLDAVQLRVDFTTPVTCVQLDAIGTAAGDRGRLEVYDANGVLLGRYTTGELAGGQSETMLVQRPAADIAYAVASGHAGAGVRLDRLRFGPETATATDALGAYAITSLPAGSYYVETVTPAGKVLAESRQQVVLADGGVLGHVDLVGYAGAISWQNSLRPTDVNDSGEVTPLDALATINYINAHAGDVRLPTASIPPPYYDVDGNGLVTAADVLIVINLLNNQASQGAGQAPAGGEAPSGPAAEGEGSSGVTTAAPSPATRQSAGLVGGNAPLPRMPRADEIPAPRSARLAALARRLPSRLPALLHSATFRSPLDSPSVAIALDEILGALAHDLAAAQA